MSQSRDERCPICDSARFETLHRQEFIPPGEIRTHYDVVACLQCGFTFAQNLPITEEYEAYYRSNLKYTYEGSRDASEARQAMYEGSFEMVDAYLSRDDGSAQARERRILDIGCSTGELLALFQRNGYRNLAGVDPTPECRDIAKALYGVDVATAVLSEVAAEEPYDVVLLANILEHIPNLREAVDRIASLTAEGGLLFVQVPDAAHFGAELKEPFSEFSIEHINYFTETSLANLLAMPRLTLRHHLLAYKGVVYPVMTSLWQKTQARRDLERSDSAPLRDYIERSRQRLATVSRAIDALVASGEPVMVWGVGSLTARFLATTNLGQANIAGFVDSNRGHHGKRLLGREIAAPSSLAGKTDTVFVSSFVYGEEISRTLRNDMRYAGRIVTL